VNSPSGRTTSITPKKHRQMPSVSTPESSGMGTGMDGMGGGGGGSDIEMSSPSGPGGMNGNGIGKSVYRTRNARSLIGRIEKPNERSEESSKQIEREIIKLSTKTTQKNSNTLILSLAERSTAILQPQIQKPSSSPSTPGQPRKSTPTSVEANRAAAVDKEKHKHKQQEPSPAGMTRMETTASTSTAPTSVTPGAGPSTAKTKN
jgi:hypothetical protein